MSEARPEIKVDVITNLQIHTCEEIIGENKSIGLPDWCIGNIVGAGTTTEIHTQKIPEEVFPDKYTNIKPKLISVYPFIGIGRTSETCYIILWLCQDIKSPGSFSQDGVVVLTLAENHMIIILYLHFRILQTIPAAIIHTTIVGVIPRTSDSK